MTRLIAMLTMLVCCAMPASAQTANTPLKVVTIAEGLNFPWSLAFLPPEAGVGDMLVVERNGGLRLIRNGQLQPEPIGGVPRAYVRSQGGLFDVLLDPDFASNRTLYLSYAEGPAQDNGLAIVRARFDGRALTQVRKIFRTRPGKRTPVHYGGRMAWLPDGTMLVTMGDGFNLREKAQTLDSHFGKILRITKDGKAPPDNPFIDREGALPEVYSYGHRNPQGLVVEPGTARVFAHEHGPRGGDELNRILPGENYGWPAATYGIDYSGARISPYTSRPGMQGPLKYWTPSIAPAGMTLYAGDLFPAWRGDLIIAALVPGALYRLRVDAQNRATQIEVMLDGLGERLRDVRTGPDGALYVLTDDPAGRVLRVTPE